jgi:hypothetical protein
MAGRRTSGANFRSLSQSRVRGMLPVEKAMSGGNSNTG